MALTVTSAFNEFQKDKVNLDTEKTKDARGSKDWLIEQIHKFPENDSDFPHLYNDHDIVFGSFPRRTKIRPLDDIDLMICISAQYSSYYPYSNPIDITVNENATTLKQLCDDYTYTLNSTKVINKFIKSLEDVSQYAKSCISKNKEAAVLELSYDWNIDIVPCFFTVPENDGRTYYLIPDGKGKWKKTDPRIDQERVTNINQRHNGRVLNLIRILKYWNKRPTMPSALPYMFENLILNIVDYATGTANEYVFNDLPYLFSQISSLIYSSVNDPKGIQGDLNTLSYEDKKKISDKATEDYKKSNEALQYLKDGKEKESITKWREIFGDEFPKYE